MAWVGRLAHWGYTPFLCFSRMMAAASSLLLANSVPVWVFLFFCRNGQYEQRGTRGGGKTNRVARLLQGLGPIVITLVTACHVVYGIIAKVSKVVGGAKCLEGERKSLEGSAAFRRITGVPLIYEVLHYTLPLDTLHHLIFE